jgi:hypothetical protein
MAAQMAIVVTAIAVRRRTRADAQIEGIGLSAFCHRLAV